jgi:tRNA pseudouridine38-40 synthase
MEDAGAKRERDASPAPVAEPVADAVADAPAAKQPRTDDDAAADAAPVADADADAADGDAADGDADGAGASGAARHPGGKKRKVVVLLGYIGVGYQGMQHNPGAVTIEDELERAFHAAGGISDDNMGDFTKARGLTRRVRVCGRAAAKQVC